MLHNLIFHMQWNGAFPDESGGWNIVMELYEQESLKNLQSRTEMDNKIKQLEAEMCDDDEKEADRNMVLQMEFTEQAEFVGIQTELNGIVQSP